MTSPASLLDANQRLALRDAWRNQHLVLFLGAGVSRDYGVPTWDTLVLELLFEHVADGSPLRQLAINYRRAMSDWLATYFDYEPTVLARLVEDYVTGGQTPGLEAPPNVRLQFLEYVRTKLYDLVVPPAHRTTLQAVADLITKVKGNVPTVVTFNFDDLLEQELKRRNFQHASIFTADRQPHGPIPIIHAHGCLPQSAPLANERITFTERDYHVLTEGVFHWALTEIVWNLRHRTVLFVGLSMADPNLRRLLDAAFNAVHPPHYQIQKRHMVPAPEQFAVLDQLQRSAEKWKQKYGHGIDKAPQDLFGILQDTVKQVDEFDSQLFNKMGVNTIWVNDYGQIAEILDDIGAPT